jgi:diguanylate cyclase (GGDEF)-like protein
VTRLPSHRFLLVLALLLLAGFSSLSWLSFLRARQLLDRQISDSILPLTSDAIRSSLQHDLLKPVLASGLMARNTFLEDALSQGNQHPEQLWQYLAEIQQKTGAITTFLVTEANGRYYHPRGILKTVSEADPQDQWYYRFRKSGRSIEINIDRDTADLRRTTAFINVMLQDSAGRMLGITGLGLDVHALQAQLQHYQKRYGARILLVDRDGRIALSSDGSDGLLRKIPALAPYSAKILGQPHTSMRVEVQGQDLYISSNNFPEIGWTLVVMQRRNADQSDLINLLTQNLVASIAISVLVLLLAQLTLGRDQRRLEAIARTDKLSGLLNRHMFEPLLNQFAAQAKRRMQPLALALLDIDHFKRVNDSQGHQVGDAVIRSIAQRLKAHTREADPLFRWGGEEFLVLLPGCGVAEAQVRLEALLRDLRAHPLRLAELTAANQDTASAPARAAPLDHFMLRVTMSVGITVVDPGEPVSQILHRADQALYQAKSAGRDRVCTLAAEHDRESNCRSATE